MKIKKFLFVTLLFISFYSCVQPKCEENKESLANIGFMTINEETGREEELTLTKFMVYGVGNEDSLLYDTVANLNLISVPLNPATGSCKYIFKYKGKNDTLSFYYEPDLQLISVECGFHTEYTLDTVVPTLNSFYKLERINDKISSSNGKNIEMYFD